MVVSLDKGGRVSLSKEAPGLTKIHIGLGWQERSTDGVDFDLDASVFLVNASKKVRRDTDFVFYGNLAAVGGAVQHMGDELSGGTGGDDEEIKIDLKRLESDAPDVEAIVVVVTIHEADQRGQNFGQVSNAFIRVANEDDGQEIVRFDLSEDYSTETAVVFGEIYKREGEWRFTAVGQGYAGGLAALCNMYGVNI